MQEEATVWLDDPHPIFRRGMAACLRADGFRVLGEGADFRPEPPTAGLDVLIFAVEGDGLRRAAQFARRTGCRVVATLREGTDDARLLEAVEAGVAGIMRFAEVTPRSLSASIHVALHGHAALSQEALTRLLHQATTSPRQAPASLTHRELRVLSMIADGEETRGIATELCYSERTVKNVIHDVLTKLNCRNRAHAVALATRQGVI